MPYANKKDEKEYQKKYHLSNWSTLKIKHSENKRIRRTALSSWLKEYKKELSCSYCRENHPACLEFHHKNSQEKENTVANMISQGYSINTIKREIDKCLVLCRNCYAKEHYQANNINNLIATE